MAKANDQRQSTNSKKFRGLLGYEFRTYFLGARSKEQGARSKEQGARNNEQRTTKKRV